MEENEKREIQKTVREILDQSDLESTTMSQLRKRASEKLGIDLNASHYKSFVTHLVDSYVQQQQLEQAEEGGGDDQEQQEEQGQGQGQGQEQEQEQEFDGYGNLIICRLSARRKVALQKFRGMNLLSIRDYNHKNGKSLPSSKGISLKMEQWEKLKENIPAIEEAIKKLKDCNA